MSDPYPRLARRFPLRTVAAGVVAVIIAVAILIMRPRSHVQPAAAAALRNDLIFMRHAIDEYRGRNGKGPSQLEDLVRDHELRSIPKDPITNANDWRLTTEETVSTGEFTSESKAPTHSIIDIHSSAPGKDFDGKAWSAY